MERGRQMGRVWTISPIFLWWDHGIDRCSNADLMEAEDKSCTRTPRLEPVIDIKKEVVHEHEQPPCPFWTYRMVRGMKDRSTMGMVCPCSLLPQQVKLPLLRMAHE
jgi:hypothetical protein